MNYQKELDKLTKRLEAEGRVPRLLLHSCCAPCSSYVLEYLSNYFSITVFYYNPNIFPESEYTKRICEQQMLIDRLTVKYPVMFVAGPYDSERFFQMAKGLEHVKEGGVRCHKCYELRLRETARMAKNAEFDYFTTTLSISPLKKADKLNEIGCDGSKVHATAGASLIEKKADKLNEIGRRLGDEYGVPYLLSDFKKKNGYKRSIELSREYGLYRQDYCGCVFSKEFSGER